MDGNADSSPAAVINRVSVGRLPTISPSRLAFSDFIFSLNKRFIRLSLGSSCLRLLLSVFYPFLGVLCVR
jgi:hypothetical protein